MFRSFPLYIVFFITIAFTVLFPEVACWLPKWLLLEPDRHRLYLPEIALAGASPYERGVPARP